MCWATPHSRRFSNDYYSRWALKHVDERAMRASAERVSGRDLGWFFAEWVHGVGLEDYALTGATTSRLSDGRWMTRATIARRGEYRHPMPVGVRTSQGWSFGRGDPMKDRETIEIVTTEQPQEVRLDLVARRTTGIAAMTSRGPISWGWVRRGWCMTGPCSISRVAIMPRHVAPLAWYSDPGGLTVACAHARAIRWTITIWEGRGK